MAKRMFVAIHVPQVVSEKLAGLDPHLPGLRWLPASQLHLTLSFLGEVTENREGALVRELGKIEGRRFVLALRGLGSFGRRGRASVVWAGLEEVPEELSRLYREVNAAVRTAGLEGDERGFHPHVTVGRCKDLPVSVLRELFEERAREEFGRFEVEDFTLYQSILRREGAEHVPVIRKDLGAG
jgi:2'-5' RNA ligase